jgi:hypothetical protein
LFEKRIRGAALDADIQLGIIAETAIREIRDPHDTAEIGGVLEQVKLGMERAAIERFTNANDGAKLFEEIGRGCIEIEADDHRSDLVARIGQAGADRAVGRGPGGDDADTVSLATPVAETFASSVVPLRKRVFIVLAF